MLQKVIDKDIRKALFPELYEADTPESIEVEAAQVVDKTESLYGREFKQAGYVQIYGVTTAIHQQGLKKAHFLNDHEFKLKAFSRAKRARNWDFPMGARGFEIVNLQDIFYTHHELGEFFDCYFLTTSQGNPYRAWLYKNSAGVVRYYSISPHNKGERYVMDAIDLYGAAFGEVLDYKNERYLRHKSYEIIREEQTILLDHRVMDEKERLEDITRKVRNRMQRELDNHTDATMSAVLQELINEAAHRTFNEGQYDNDGRTIFFMSTGVMAQRIDSNYSNDDLVKKSKTTLNNAINVLSALGFITKLDDEELEKYSKGVDLAYERNKRATFGKNPVSYYVINDIPSVYWVNKQAKKLLNKNINLHNVTERAFKRALGPEDAKKIFIVDFATKKEEQYQKERREYIRTFLLRIKEQGFVTKEELEDIIPSKNVSNKLWTRLASETRGLYFKRSNKNLRKDLDIETTGAVFVSSVLAHPNEPTFKLHHSVEEDLMEALLSEYEELTAQVLLWYDDIFDKDYSKEDKAAEMEAHRSNSLKNSSYEFVKEVSVMSKNEVDKRGDFRFMNEDYLEVEEEFEVIAQPKKPSNNVKDPSFSYEDEGNQPREPKTDDEIEKARKAEEFFKRWGV